MNTRLKHVTSNGGSFTPISEMWNYANGVFLPLFVSLVFVLLYRKACKSSFYRIFSYMVAIIPIGSLLTWVFIPFLYMNDTAPVNEDVTKFLNTFTQYFHPLLLTVFALAIMGFSILLLVKKRVFRNFIEEISMES